MKLPVRTPHRNVTNTGSLATARKESLDEAKIGDITESCTLDGIVEVNGKIHLRIKSLEHT